MATEAYRALCDDMAISEAMLQWREDHPEENFADDPYASALVHRRIETYQRFLDTHPFIKDRGFLDDLRSLLEPA